MGREYTRDASEHGQKLIADAIEKVALSVSVDDTLTVEGASADAKATGDGIAALGADVTGLQGDVTGLQGDVTELQGLISSDVSVYTLFGKVITFEQDGTITWTDPEVEDSQPSEE